MIHIKRGRGPSFMQGIFALVFATVAFFMFQFTNTAARGLPTVFRIVPLLFVLVGIGLAIYSFYNAVAQKRMSEMDITTNREEPDPIDEVIRRERSTDQPTAGGGSPNAAGKRKFPGEFCPFCGERAGEDFDYCSKCGKDI